MDFTKCVKNTIENIHALRKSPDRKLNEKKRKSNENRKSTENISERDINSTKKVLNKIKDNLLSYGINVEVILNEIYLLQNTLKSPTKQKENFHQDVLLPKENCTTVFCQNQDLDISNTNETNISEITDIPNTKETNILEVTDVPNTKETNILEKTSSEINNNYSYIDFIPNITIDSDFNSSFLNIIEDDIIVLEDIQLQTKSSNVFDNHLTYPNPIKRSNNTNRPKPDTPSAISSAKWRVL